MVEGLGQLTHLPIRDAKAGVVGGLSAQRPGLLVDSERRFIVVDGLP